MDAINLMGTAGDPLEVEGEPDGDGEVEFSIGTDNCGCGDEVVARAYLNRDQRRALVAHLNAIDDVQ